MNKYKNLTASALLKTGEGTVSGFIVNSHTAGTLKLWDSTTAANLVIVNTYTFPAGSSVVAFPDDVSFTVGLYATIGGTADITVVYR